MMDKELLTFGYKLEPTRYKPQLGYARLKAAIAGKPTQRYFDAKLLRIPTFDGRFTHQTQITRHGLTPQETLQVCLGWITLEGYQGDPQQFFSFGGVLKTLVEDDYRCCEFASNAPIFKRRENPGAIGHVLVDEIVEILAEIASKLSQHEDEVNARMAAIQPYEVFLSCLVTLQKRLSGVPAHLRREKFQQANAEVQKIIHILRTTDGWDGCSPTLEELLVKNA
jgi:hypothetical protein